LNLLKHWIKTPRPNLARGKSDLDYFGRARANGKSNRLAWWLQFGHGIPSGLV